MHSTRRARAYLAAAAPAAFVAPAAPAVLRSIKVQRAPTPTSPQAAFTQLLLYYNRFLELCKRQVRPYWVWLLQRL